jgi:hypothetical protein
MLKRLKPLLNPQMPTAAAFPSIPRGRVSDCYPRPSQLAAPLRSSYVNTADGSHHAELRRGEAPEPLQKSAAARGERFTRATSRSCRAA